MLTPPTSRFVTPEQYLKYEQAREFKSEYVDGVIVNISEERDRGEKWLAYKEIASLNTYVLIHTDRPLVEVYNRNPDGRAWGITEAAGLDATVSLPVVGIEIPMDELYYDLDIVSF